MNSPFKFLDAYQKEDLDIFFGRGKETEALYQALSGVKHLLVYGASGTGKTSLVECGLRNQFSDADWLALSIRKRNNINESVLQAINEALEEKIEGIDDFGQAVESLFAERYQPIYLLFDQFEELLILGEKQEKEEFFERLNRLIRHKVPCRVMLIMREEFIGHLSEFEHLCPSIFQHRFRLEKMNKSHVKEVIEKTLTAPKYQNSFEINDSEALIEAILACLPDEKKEIELAHVQVFLDQLWERAYAQKTSEKPVLIPMLVREDDRLESVLNNFLTTQLAELDKSYGKNVALELLAVMISEKHTKLQVEEEALGKDLAQKRVTPQKPLKELLKDLEKRRTLRTLKANEQTQYEISHDLLAKAVGQNLTEEMKMREKAQDIYKVLLEKQGHYSQEDLDLVRPYQQYWAFPVDLEKRVMQSETHLSEQKEKELKEAKARTEKERNLSRRAYYVAAFALLIAVMAGYFYFNAEEAKKKSIQKEQEAQESKQQAEQSLQEAEKQRQIALAQKDTAAAKEQEAIIAQLQAEKAKAAVQAQLDQIRKKDQLQLSTYADNVGKALARYDISEARREMEKIRQTQIATKDLLTRLERQIADTVQTLMPDMVKVEGSTFLMGCDSKVDECRDKETQHQVSLNTYQIGKYEVTQALWQKVMGSNPSYFQPSNGKTACPACPVEQVNWNEIQKFIEKLNEKTGKKYRLPTEAEWEYAARGGKQSQNHLYAGTTEAINDYVWYTKNSDSKTKPIGTKKPNELGIYDMSGSVWEWCSDKYGDYPTDPQTNPKGAETGSLRVLRGGSWSNYNVSHLRVAYRNGYTPTVSDNDLGFRLARID